jgi:YYY domain-containing protein
MTDFIAWYLLITLVGWISFPLAFRLLPLLPDRGFTLARPLGLLLWGFGFWLLASLGVLQNDSGGILVGLVVLLGLSVWSMRSGGFAEIWTWIKANKGLVITAEALFLVAFGFLALVRAGDPAILGTEKPMEMAFINAILRSPAFPPNDPWLSGYSISYYYFGYVLVAMLIRLAGVEPGVGFNLAIASWFALTALASYGVVYSLLSVYAAQAAAAGRRIKALGWALAAPLFLLIVSNIEGFLEVLHSRGIFWRQSADGTWGSGFWRWLNMPEICAPPTPPFSWVPERAAGIWWWRASRVIQDYDMSHVIRIASGEQCVVGREVIDEFPFFSYYLADLHPHVLAMPFALLAIGLALHLYFRLYRSPIEGTGILEAVQSWTAGNGFALRSLALGQWLRRVDFWLAAVATGGLAFLNTWDFPIYVALFSAAYSLANYQRLGWSIRRFTEFIENGAALGIAGILLYLPFYFGFSSQAGGLLPSLSFFTRGINFWIMFAPLLVPIFAWLLWLWKQHGNRLAFRSGLIFAGAITVGLWLVSYLFGWLALSLGDFGDSALSNLGRLFAGLHYGESVALFENNPTAVIWNSLGRRLSSPGAWLTMFALTAGVWGLLAAGSKDRLDEEDKPRELEYHQPSVHPFVLLLILVGVGLALVPEFLYLRDQFATRMNTIFKFYFQVWILWSVVAAYATGLLAQAASPLRKALSMTAVAVVLMMGLAYPIFGLGMRFSSMQPENMTLDGTAHIEIYNPDEMAGIRFLRERPVGPLVEAVGGQYSGYARIATNTGIPNVLGWPGHQSQWRGGGEEMGSRQVDIKRLYETPNWGETQEIIQQYGIRYIYIGGMERNTYRVHEVKFQNYLTPIFQQGSVVIYEVPPDIQVSTGLKR